MGCMIDHFKCPCVITLLMYKSFLMPTPSQRVEMGFPGLRRRRLPCIHDLEGGPFTPRKSSYVHPKGSAIVLGVVHGHKAQYSVVCLTHDGRPSGSERSFSNCFIVMRGPL